MSRRQKPPPNPALRPNNAAVVCTDRGQHPEAIIADFSVDTDGPEDAPVTGITWMQTPNSDLVARQLPDGSLTYRFRCRRCRRDVRLRHPKLAAIVTGMYQAPGGKRGRLILDISHRLPLLP